MTKQKIENKEFLNVNKFLKTISDTNRLRILTLLNGDSMNVTDIHTKLKLPQNLTSHHISKLKALSLLNEKKEGTFRHYSVNTKQLREYYKLCKELFNL